MTNLEFYEYLLPIVNGCSGFISTRGYMAYIPGLLIMVSEDGTIFSYIHLPVTHPIQFGCYIKSFLRIKKEDELKKNFLFNIYTIGDNIRFNNCMKYYDRYKDIGTKGILYYSEDDCDNIENFRDNVSKSAMSYVRVSDGKNVYMIPSSKWITPLTKNDTCKLRIYNSQLPRLEEARTLEYIVYKKKFNLDIHVITNIIIYK